MNCTLCALIRIVSKYADCFSIHLLLPVLEEEIFFFNVIMNWLNLDDILIFKVFFCKEHFYFFLTVARMWFTKEYLYHVNVMLIVI